MRRLRIAVPGLAAAAMIAVAAASPVCAQTFVPRDESPDEYPAGPGREPTFYFCSACHGFKIVAQQGQSRQQWDDTLDWMTQRHNMPKLEGNDRKTILDYLEASFPPRAPRGGWQNPFQNR